jgi:phage repressor protein C with HTH and peptisase S24 domain
MSTIVVDEAFQRRLRLIMQQFGSVADLARAVGVSDNAIYKWVSGRGQPGMMSLVNLAKASGVSVEWLATGRGVAAEARSNEHGAAADDFVAMPRHGLKSAGARAALQSLQIVDYLSFRLAWVQRMLHADADHLALVEAVGDSMSPTIDEGDLVLVDLREPRFHHDGVYALRTGADLAIKRIQRQPDGTLLIRGDNPAYEPAIVSDDRINLLGRVLWVGGRL